MEGNKDDHDPSSENVKLVPFICGEWIGLKRGFNACAWWNFNLNEIPEKEKTSVRICCISDTHEREAKLVIPPCDLLLHAGDITRCGSHEAAETFCGWIHSCNEAKEKVFIVGNHDLFYDFTVLQRRNINIPTIAQIENLDSKLTNAANYLKEEGNCVSLKCGLTCGG